MHPVTDHIVICAVRRAEAMKAARRFPNERGIFVRLAWAWHRSMMRQIAAERANRALGLF